MDGEFVIPSNIPMLSSLQQGTESILHQRQGLSQGLAESWELLTIGEANYSLGIQQPKPPPPEPSPDPSTRVGEINAIPWTVLTDPGPISIDAIYRQYIPPDKTAPNPPQYHASDQAIADNNWARLGFPATNQPVWPGLPNLNGRFGQFGPFLNQGPRQASLWYQSVNFGFDNSIANGPAFWSSNTFWMRGRWRYTWPSNGWMALADLYVYDQRTGVRRGDAGYNGSGALTMDNVRMYSDPKATTSNTWIEAPFVPALTDGPYPATFAQGFVGRILFEIDFETPAAWHARTGA